jgi:hypothetical protein
MYGLGQVGHRIEDSELRFGGTLAFLEKRGGRVDTTPSIGGLTHVIHSLYR